MGFSMAGGVMGVVAGGGVLIGVIGVMGVDAGGNGVRVGGSMENLLCLKSMEGLLKVMSDGCSLILPYNGAVVFVCIYI